MLIYRVMFFIPVFTIAGIIFYLSDQPQVEIPMQFELGDKILHFIAYTVLGLAILLALTGNKPSMKRRNIIVITLILGLLFGISDELHQSYVPGRDPSVLDLIADFLGLIFSCMFLKYIRKLIIKVYGRDF